MFSGIVEAQSQVLKLDQKNQSLQITIERPQAFDDIKNGDSICTDGVCLTIEKFDDQTMQFSLGAETLKVLNIAHRAWPQNTINVERSLKFGDRVHGHFVSGHVDSLVEITRSEALGDSWLIDVIVPNEYAKLVWKKGSITLNGVSLTINEVVKAPQGQLVSVCLIPETIERTNLKKFKAAESLHFEADYFAKSILRITEAQNAAV